MLVLQVSLCFVDGPAELLGCVEDVRCSGVGGLFIREGERKRRSSKDMGSPCRNRSGRRGEASPAPPQQQRGMVPNKNKRKKRERWEESSTQSQAKRDK